MSIPKPPFRVIQHELVETWPMKGCKVKSQVTKAHIKLSKGWYLLLIFVLFINFLLVFMVVFTTKEKKKRPIKVLFGRKKHNLKSFTSHHLVPFRNIHSAERICKEQNQLFRLCSETGVSANGLSASSWPYDPSSDREERKCQTASAL